MRLLRHDASPSLRIKTLYFVPSLHFLPGLQSAFHTDHIFIRSAARVLARTYFEIK